MAIEGNLDYALTRVYARHGQRLDEAGWRRVEASRDLGHYTAAARSTALAIWVGAMNVDRDCHAIERSLRSQWRHYVNAVARWHPREWQAWLEWIACLPYLSMLGPLARPESMPTWMLADPMFGRVALGTGRAGTIANAALAPLEAAIAGRTTPRAAWIAHWQVIQPRSDRDTRRSFAVLRRAIEEHDRNLIHAKDSAEPHRQRFAARLHALMRAAAGTVIVTVCHLGLVALDIERLRGGLARRCLFGGTQAAHD